MTTLSNLTKVRKNYEGATLPAHHCHRINCSFVAGVMDAFCIPSSRPTATVHRPDFTQALIAKLKSFLGAASLLPKKQLGYIYICTYLWIYTETARKIWGQLFGKAQESNTTNRFGVGFCFFLRCLRRVIRQSCDMRSKLYVPPFVLQNVAVSWSEHIHTYIHTNLHSYMTSHHITLHYITYKHNKTQHNIIYIT